MVYVVQEDAKKNITPASEYGEIQILLPPGQIVYSPGPSMARLRIKLKNFGDEDYLLCIGDPVAIAMAAMVASHVNNGKVKFLKWDRQETKYIPINTNLHGREEIND